jgi:hypothetical protein
MTIERGNPKYLKNVPHFYFFHHKSHKERILASLLRSDAVNLCTSFSYSKLFLPQLILLLLSQLHVFLAACSQIYCVYVLDIENKFHIHTKYHVNRGCVL